MGQSGRQLKTRLFSPQIIWLYFSAETTDNRGNWDFRIQHASRIHASQKFESPAAFPHSPDHNIGDAGLVVVSSAASRRESASCIPVYARQQHVSAPDGRSARYRWPVANCCAGCSFGGSGISPAPRWTRGRHGGECPAREAQTLLEEEARHQHECAVGRSNSEPNDADGEAIPNRLPPQPYQHPFPWS